MSDAEPNRRTAPPPIPRALVWAAAISFGAGLGLLLFAISLLFRPPPPPKEDIALRAKAMLERHNAFPLSEPLAKILADWKTYADATQDHRLIGKPAPDFTLTSSDGSPVTLKSLVAKGPVVLVFYYGYYCDHCVAQLYGINRDLAYFKELGAEVAALSADTPEETRAKFAEYKDKGGAFAFPVLSDPENKVAELYDCFFPFKPGRPELQLHGTFLIDQKGIVRFAHTGLSPYTNHRSLLGYLDQMRKEGGTEKSPAD
jgi:thioredoxin-dependent peroxiredoxin